MLQSRFLDTADPNTGMTPLLVAIKSQNLQAIKTLIGKKVSLDCVDNEANTVLHYAASTNKEIVSVSILLQKQFMRCLKKFIITFIDWCFLNSY